MDDSKPLSGLRVAVVYDCLYPYTVGGGERWYRYLAEGLRDAGADVSYLTRRQWDEPPDLEHIRVVAVSARSELYDDEGRRKLAPTLRFGGGVGRWLIRHRHDFDVIEVANFPFWSLLAIRLALIGTTTRVVVDWFEIWSLEFWRAYAGGLMGAVGYLVQRLCLAVSPTIVALSSTNAARLVGHGHRGTTVVLVGLLPSMATDGEQMTPPSQPPFVLFAGRHIRDKGVDLLPEAFELTRRQLPEVRFVVAGDGPMRAHLEAECVRLGLSEAVDVVGFVSDGELSRLLAEASCVVVPSRREGYGFMVVDAMGKGTPVVTTAFDENLAVDHIESGRNGLIASPPTPSRLAACMVEVVLAGDSLRQTTLDWYQKYAPTKTVECAVAQMVVAHLDWARTCGVTSSRYW